MPAQKKHWRIAPAEDICQFLALVDSKWREWTDENTEDIEPWFRGHGDAAWALAPGLYRPPYDTVDEDTYRHEFRLRAHPFLGEATYQPQSIWDFYFLMQHHGLPTRLLDWSESALVALFFAVQRGPLDDATGAVWMLHPWKLNQHIARTNRVTAYDSSTVKPYLWQIWKRRSELPDAPIAFEPPHNSRRLAAQRGKFTIHGKIRRGLESYAALKQGLAKITLAPAAKERIRRQLSIAGITEGVIFPNLAGLSAEIKDGWTYTVD